MSVLTCSRWRCVLGVAVVAAVVVGMRVGHAHHLLPAHSLNCSADFPCPSALHRRIDFWIAVYKDWGKDTAIFHHPAQPSRVYSIINSGHGCYSQVASQIKKERARIKETLKQVAKKLAAGQALTTHEQHFAELFRGEPPAALRQATEKIRCQTGTREYYIDGLRRFNHYQALVDRVIAQYDLPYDIRYLPFVESSYNPLAYSRVGAAGMWQIMPYTARVLGLKLDSAIDQRLDPEAATDAAARYLVDARARLTTLAKTIDPTITDEKISPFIITSYNYGVRGMEKAMARVAPDYLTVLSRYKSPNFQVAVQNFYASFLAARHVARNAERYFGYFAVEPPRRHAIVTLQNATSIARIAERFAVAPAILKPLNPALRQLVWAGQRLMPSGYQLKLPYRADNYAAARTELRALPPEVEQIKTYVVRRGDTACLIARRLKVSCRALIRANQLNKRALIKVGQVLEVPGRVRVAETRATTGDATNDANGATQGETSAASTSSATTTQPHVADSTAPRRYTVRRGDTACLIAQRLNVSCRALITVNHLNARALIKVGQVLTVPRGTATAAKPVTVASASDTTTQPITVAHATPVDILTIPIEPKPMSPTTTVATATPPTPYIKPANMSYAMRAAVRAQPATVVPATVTEPVKPPTHYAVQSGDTACVVAERLAVSCARLRKLNHLNRNATIYIGQKLKIPRP